MVRILILGDETVFCRLNESMSVEMNVSEVVESLVWLVNRIITRLLLK